MILRFAHPAALILLAIPLVMLIWWFINRRRFEQPVMLYSDTRLLDSLPSSLRVQLRRLPDVLRTLAWILLVIGLARPQSGVSQEIIRGQGIDIVMALDISGSMSALDFAPQNRLEAAKQVIGDFISGREFDRVGLVVFARDAFHQSPPTLDYDVLLKLLNEVQMAPELALEDGTAIGMGLASAANMLRTSAATSKVIILLTDGANNAGAIDPVTAAQAVSLLGMRVYTIGMGRTGLVPVPIDEAGSTQLVESDLDEPTLQSIAATTGGLYFRAEDLAGLEEIYAQINTLERSEVERQVYVRWSEQAEPFLWTALILLIVERVLRHTVFQTIP
jgi:Ca-activated chloride channel homolog